MANGTKKAVDLASLTPERRRLVELWLRTKAAAPPSPAPSGIPRRSANAPCPLSFAQQQFWFVQQWEPESVAYTIPIAVRIEGPCDPPALVRSLQAIVARHEILRTTFLAVDGQPQQIIAPALALPLRQLDLTALPPSIHEQQTEHLFDMVLATPFDLERGPLLRAYLLRLAADAHVLLITLHHIVFDDWSHAVLVRELLALYAAFHAGQPAPLPALPIQYGDYAAWQRQRAATGQFDDQLAFWTAQLRDAPVLLDLPTDYPRPPIASAQGTSYLFALPAALRADLTALSRQSGTTLFMMLLAAFSVLIARVSGQTDLLIGTSIAGRTQAEVEGLIGLFANVLALRTRLEGNPPFRELLQRVRSVTLAAYDHQAVAFEQVLQALTLTRDPSRHPLFQVGLVVQTAPQPTLQGAGVEVKQLEVRQSGAVYDLTLVFREEQGGLRGRLEYRTDLFEATTIARLVRQFQLLFAGIVAEPDQRIAALPLLSAAERRQMLIEWNDTTAEYPRDATIHEIFEAQATRFPDAVAIMYDEGRRTKDEPKPSSVHLTYAALDRRANQLAHTLQTHGVGPDALVGVYMDRSLELVIALLGTLKAGGAYVPLDPAYPSERITFMLEDAQVRVLVTNDELSDKETSRQADKQIDPLLVCLSPPLLVSPSVVDLAADWPTIAHEPAEEPPSRAGGANLAYVIYTSGSTGTPKGVPIPHHAVVNHLHAMRQRPGLTDQDALLSVTTLSFDIAALELFLPLTSGARLVLTSREVAADGAGLAATLASSGATVMQATPATWRMLLDAGWLGRRDLTILCGGEAFSRELADQLRIRSRSLWNMYGPTETTIWSAAIPVVDAGGPVPIGRPIANTQIYLLDQAMQPTPVGVAGELYIGGVQLARGYLGRPDLTAERFIPNPFATVGSWQDAVGSLLSATGPRLPTADCRLYKTGDLTRWRADGQLEFLGRADQQVKLRGFRIELGEVEAGLLAHPSVRSCVVLLREDAPGEQWLVAYIVPTEGTGDREQGTGNGSPQSTVGIPRSNDWTHSEPSSIVHHPSSPNEDSDSSLIPRPSARAAELRSYLAARLPAYMIPSAFVVLDALPLTSNGKIDRRALPAPGMPASEAIFVAPRDENEELLAGIWAEVLRRERIGIHDIFFEIGGHSLLATQVLARMRKVFGVELPLRALFETPTVADLAARVATMQDIARRLGERRDSVREDMEEIAL